MNINPDNLPFSLPAEAKLFLDDSAVESTNYIELWMRALRSALIASEFRNKIDLSRPITNCIGAVALFNCAINKTDDPGNLLLLRSSWQHPENQTSIHVVSTVLPDESETRLFVDPMPAAGYMYGTAGKMTNINDDIYVAEDETIDARSYFKMLQDGDIAAIVEFYCAKALIETQPEEAYDRLKAILDALDQLPSYQAKACILLDQLEQEKTKDNYWLNNIAIISGIPDKKVDILNSYTKQKQLKDRIDYEREQAHTVFTAVTELINEVTDPYDKNYWQGVAEMLKLGHRAMGSQKWSRLSRLDFYGPNPIKEYESYMLTNHLGYCASDIYRDRY